MKQLDYYAPFDSGECGLAMLLDLLRQVGSPGRHFLPFIDP